MRVDDLWEFCQGNQDLDYPKDILDYLKGSLNQELRVWRKIEEIIDHHTSKYADKLNKKCAEIFHFGSTTNSDYDDILAQNELYKRQSFVWTNKDSQSDDSIDSDENSEWEERYR